MFGRRKKQSVTKFTWFFTKAPRWKKERVFRRVLKEVNKEQRELVERYKGA